METERAKRLAGFVSWVGANIKGDEKGEAQIFLDRLFQAFGHAGRERGRGDAGRADQEGRGKGTAFADLVWKPVVLIEMKKRGEDLPATTARRSTTGPAWSPAARATSSSATSTSSGSTTSRPRWTPRWTRSRSQELPTRWGPLAFLFPTPQKPDLRQRPRRRHPQGRRRAGRLLQQAGASTRPAAPSTPHGPAIHPANAGGPVRRRHRAAGAVFRHQPAGRLQNDPRQPTT